MIRITMRNGSFVAWDKNSYTDYMYDGKCFIITYNDKWVGIYNMDHVRSITVDK
ncbi:MAG: hypothetical protein LUI87_02375 [Lachnospiraceae bacterium]|nr:hypothetical protein [Lachnospiraceae bacterium]